MAARSKYDTLVDPVVDDKLESFEVVVEQVIGKVTIDPTEYGVSPLVAAFMVIGEHVDEKTFPGAGTFRFRFRDRVVMLDVDVAID